MTLILKNILGAPAHLHHAHVIIGPREEVKKAIAEYVEAEIGVPFVGNPDITHFSFDLIGVDDGRAISSAARIRPLSGHRLVIVEANFLTREAQNALLKSLEEPVSGTYFFFILPQSETLLPTVRSRVLIHTVLDESESVMKTRAKEFLKASPGERLKIARELAKEVSDDDITKADVLLFLAELERIICKGETSADVGKTGGKRGETDKNMASMLASIQLAKKYLADRAPSVKMLLEHMVLS